MSYINQEHLKRGGVAILIVAAAAMIHSLPLGTDAPLQIELRNALHTPAFAAIAALLFLNFRRAFSLPGALAISSLAALATGVLGEMAQYVSYGQASFSDLARDAIGIPLGLLVGTSISRLPNKSGSRRVDAVLIIAALIGAVVVIHPAADAGWAIAKQRYAHPHILTFEADWETRIFSANRGATVRLEPAPATWGQGHGRIAYVKFANNRYSGIEIFPVTDWSGFDSLSLTAASGTDMPVELSLRIHDEKHWGGYRDRFRRKLNLTAEKRVFRIRMSDILDAPVGRHMDATQIRSIILFVDRPEGGEFALLDDIKLVRE